RRISPPPSSAFDRGRDRARQRDRTPARDPLPPPMGDRSRDPEVPPRLAEGHARLHRPRRHALEARLPFYGAQLHHRATGARLVRILALVHRVPYPPNKGEKIRAFHELKYLAAKGHAIDLATFADVEEDTGWKAALSTICRDVEIVRMERRIS